MPSYHDLILTKSREIMKRKENQYEKNTKKYQLKIQRESILN